MAEDYYATLGVEQGSSPEEIKRAYRRLAHQHHPDKSGGNEEKFKQVNAAYQVLSDEKKRAQYDQYGQTFEAGGPTSEGFGDFTNVGDIFEQFFSGGRTRAERRVNRGQDISVDAAISFAESARGTTHKISHRVHQTCAQCHGNGAEPGTPIKTCPTCQGQGTVSTARRTMLGVFTQSSVCSTCQGEGKQAEQPCRQCRGDGRELKDRTLDVEIPAGIADGQTIRLTGKGEAAPKSGVPGDLYVTVHVQSHPTLQREGDNVRSAITLPFADAALGIDMEVETLNGRQPLTIPAGTQPETEFILSRLGFPQLSGPGRGDHIVITKIEIPKRLTRQQKKLLNEFKRSKRKSLFT